VSGSFGKIGEEVEEKENAWLEAQTFSPKLNPLFSGKETHLEQE
jgi:hypothetical protein